MKNEPTKKQLKILEFVSYFTEENGVSPTYREIANGVGLSSSASVAEHIENLIDKGLLMKNPGEARSLQIVNETLTETEQLFLEKFNDVTEAEKEILKKAAKILNLKIWS